ncbi:biopolymer transport protein ExbB/TolQ [Rhizobium leguminosarum]|uniref:Biopolymer transport protein ExbB/TolQ n=1 Tax=Rhizobium leguminosarum TaxID=384 RepID=A0AAE2MPP9_RHILE|nr:MULTISPECIES: hypothetical protein [Rhizobium]MBB4292965.1 biopolymer transport protein ExbB/TolQ [Rhizobium leguminosarum]MBB4298999.1 biopolymer transport protein ExbB/TolQ [Rhizobium leguminosarum]MBB4310498.1 biopolymer transport protein ExbB/TolQ [Rhizobium leguminosarum]MBB4419614.1 biopolymer transport protein ExbB/TolQ [Rhizobium leguminosarum]MBB4434760.1 biopolymer transport protein ExbB/TolQ [Rhizobium esperanzae]
MQIATTSASIILRGASSATAISAAGNETDQGVLKLQRTTQALQQIRQTLATSEEEDKTKAQRKLEEAQQQLEMLRSSNMPPEVVARLAAELARKVGAAASEFASSVATGSSAVVVPADATSDATATATSGAAAALTDTSGESGTTATGAQEPDAATSARNAYQSVAEDAPKFSSISTDDRETMEEFKAVVRELKQLLEKAMHDLRQQNRQPGANAVPDMADLSSATATIPTSIVI